jgi:hypothetical protein
MVEKTCLQCGKRFTPWRGKTFCSERCRKQAQNRRLRRDETAQATPIADSQNPEKIDEQNQELAKALRRDEGAFWIACNEVTDKFARKGGDAIGWTMKIEGQGWFGRVGKEMSFGPTNRSRARSSVEAFLRGEPFEKHEDEHSWRGDCWRIVTNV